MTTCHHTGITQPECSCTACLQAQIEQHMPSLLAATAASGAPTTDEFGAVSGERSRLGAAVRRRFSRFRRAA
jgi:hypothetical protein